MTRLRAAVVGLALVLAACGGGGDDGDDAETLSAEDAERAVARALLDDDDLGDGWEETGRTDPDDVDADDTPLDDCLSTNLHDAIVASRLAESDTVQLELDGGDVFTRTLVTVTTTAFESTDVIDELLEAYKSEEMGSCLGRAVEQLLGETSLEIGEPTMDEGYVTLDDVRSVHVTVPLHAPRYEIELAVVVIARGQLASSLVTVQLGGAIDGESVARWATLLADRQRLDAAH